MLDTYALTVPVFGPGGAPVAGAQITATLTVADYSTLGVIMPSTVKAQAGADGVAILDLVSNLVGTQDSRYQIAIRSGSGSLIAITTIQMPQANTSLQQLVDTLPITTQYITAATLSASIATTQAELAAADAAQTALDRIATAQDRAAVQDDKGITTQARAEAVAAAERINTLFWLGV